jgi:hypothetical protein
MSVSSLVLGHFWSLLRGATTIGSIYPATSVHGLQLDLSWYISLHSRDGARLLNYSAMIIDSHFSVTFLAQCDKA